MGRPMRRISSRQNPLVARFRELARGRDASGTRAARRRASRRGGARVRRRRSTPSRSPSASSTRAPTSSSIGVERAGADVVARARPVLAAMSPVQQPSGIVAHRAAATARRSTRCCAARRSWSLMLAGVQDAGNVGAIVRAAEAAAPPASSPRRARPIRSAGRRCAARWAARSGCRSRSGSRSRATLARLRERGIAIVATVPRDGTPLPRAELARPGRDPARRRRRRASRTTRRRRRRAAHDPDAAAGRVAQRRDHGRPDPVRSRATATSTATCPSSTEPESRAERRLRHASRRSPSACGRARSTSSSARKRCSAPGRPLRQRDRARSPAVDHPVGPARHRQDDAGARSSRGVTRARFVAFSAVLSGIKEIRAVMAEAEEIAAAARPAHDSLRRRDPPLQQGAAGRVPAARRSRRHRAHRRDDGEPVVRGELGAAVAVEGLRPQAARADDAMRTIVARARRRIASAASAAIGVVDRRRGACAAIARYANGDARDRAEPAGDGRRRGAARRRRPADRRRARRRPGAEPRRCSTTRPARSTTT